MHIGEKISKCQLIKIFPNLDPTLHRGRYISKIAKTRQINQISDLPDI